MKRPYKKKYGDFFGFRVWIVDGRYVRENINEEFTNFGQHLRYKFIPKNEFWIDEEHDRNEIKYYVDHLLTEHRLMEEGVSLEKALAYADSLERRERNKSNLFRRLRKKIKHKDEILKRIHKKMIKEFSTEKLKVWIVDGCIVRDLFDIDFTEGGNDQVYHYIPHGEIWIDDDLDVTEIPFVLLHEMHERNLMAKGWSYSPDYEERIGKIKRFAHQSAIWIEYYCRKHPREIKRKLKEEMLKTV